MQIQFWGAAQCVTGSMHLLSVNGHKLLLDCGLYQGKRKEAFERNRTLPFDASQIDAVILSHAHIDHSGNLPSLVRSGFNGPIYTTSATRDLDAYMLLDSAHIQESDVAYVNKRRAKQGKTLFEPLYTRRDAMNTLTHFSTVEYGRPFEPAPGVQVHFRDAGHILGSAIVVIDVTEHGRKRRLVFSGDLGRRGLPILRNPQVAEDVDFVIMESTYGNRLHASTGEAKEMLRQTAQEVYDRRGKLIIPSFAVGRTQELAYRLDQLWEEDRLPPIDVFVDSPLAVNVTEVFRLHPECYNEEMLDAMLSETDRDPLSFRNLRYIRSVEDSKRLNELETSAIIISASGMCEAGRILHHLKHNIEDPRTTVMFVGYQAENTLGRKILEGQNPVPILGEEYALRAEVKRAEGYSAHADRRELLDWAARIQSQGDLKRVFLVHGEEEGLTALAEGLREQGVPQIDIPERGQVFEL
ncbi:MAG: MBL fold metallo-hydrolase [Anaerolineae bacterium]